METTIGRLLLNEHLPEDMRDGITLDKKGIRNLFETLASKHPEEYAHVNHMLHTLGSEIATTHGREASVSLSSFKTPEGVKKLRDALNTKIKAVMSSNLPQEEKNHKVIELVSDATDEIEKTNFDEHLKNNNPLAIQVLSGSRGNKSQLRSMTAGDLLVVDHKDNPIPVPITSSFSEGLDPVQYWAASYGARKGAISTKFSTPKSGYLGKQLAMAAHRLLVTEKDCGTANGISVDANDPDNVGAVLAANVGKFTAGTVITPKILKELGTEKIMVRSPMTCTAEKGICQRCAGIREKGEFPPIGDNVGVAAAHAISEPVGQGQLCLAGGTAVRMADWSIKKIEDIRPNDYVLGCDKLGRTFPSRVVRVYDNGVKPVYHTVFRASGSKRRLDIMSTLDHKILAMTHKSSCEGEKLNNAPQILPIGTKASHFMALAADGSFSSSGLVFEPRALKFTPRFWCTRDSQTLVGDLNTFDIEIDTPDHLFVLANGLVVSNSVKHTGGLAQKVSQKQGLDLINQIVQVPETFPDAAAVADLDGTVDRITDAPQGGKYVIIGKKEHYVPNGHDISVKLGDTVEAGDVLSSGIPNPAQIVMHKGIGEGRKYFADLLHKTLKEGGFGAHRRNVELLSRGLVNHVRVTDVDGPLDTVPDDVLEYDDIVRGYTPRHGSVSKAPKHSVGLYLEQPVLHYSIGTRITPRVAKTFEDNKIPTVTAHADPPSFVPEMSRAMETAAHSSDWMVRMGGLYGVKRSVMKGVHRAAESNLHGTSFIPSLAKGIEFGKDPEGKGY